MKIKVSNLIKFNVIISLLIVIILLPSVVSAEKLYRTGEQVIGHDGRGNRVLLQGEAFDGEICQSSPSFYTVNYQGSQFFVANNQLTTLENESSYLADSRQYFSGEDVVSNSKAVFANPGTQVPGSEYLVPVYWGTKGVAGPKGQDAIDNLVVTGDFNTDLTAVCSTVINMNLTYGGDVYQQIESIENGYTKCCGVTWLVAKLLDKTMIEYRFVLQHDTNSPTNYDYKNAGHIYLEVKSPDGSWRVLEACELLTSASGKAPQLNDAIWGVQNTKAKSFTIINENASAGSYQVLIKSVGFQQGQVITPAAEKVVINLY